MLQYSRRSHEGGSAEAGLMNAVSFLTTLSAPVSISYSCYAEQSAAHHYICLLPKLPLTAYCLLVGYNGKAEPSPIPYLETHQPHQPQPHSTLAPNPRLTIHNTPHNPRYTPSRPPSTHTLRPILPYLTPPSHPRKIQLEHVLHRGYADPNVPRRGASGGGS